MRQPAASVLAPTAQKVVATKQHARPIDLAQIATLAVLSFFAVYFLVPYVWLVVSATKSVGDLFGTFGLWFAPNFNLLDNVQQLFTYQDGIYVHWLLHTLLYARGRPLVGTGLATIGCTALAKYTFRRRDLAVSHILGPL